MRKAYIILITKNYRVEQLQNILFLVVREYDESILLEDGTESVGKVIKGYPVAQLPNGQIQVSSIPKYTFLASDIKYKKIADCYYVNVPHIVRVETDETENQSEEAQ
jgi:hypothetical protein